MKFCKKCVMPDTRPGISFDDEGICLPCRHAELKKNIDWDARLKELKQLCDKYRRKSESEYDCLIAVSGGKDSHYQVHIMKEVMGMNPLLITVEDLFTQTEAAKHNIYNITRAFRCNLIAFKPNPVAGKKICRYTFEKYGRPSWYFDRLLYSVPLHYASILKLPLLVYGENVAYEYGGLDKTENYSARELIYNGVAPDISLEELMGLGIDESELIYLKAPGREALDKIDPMYLSYFVEWLDQRNYEFAKSRGFKDLSNEWERTNYIDNFTHVDSYGFVLGSWLKYPKFGQAFATDFASRLVRNGLITRDEAVKLVEEKDHNVDRRIIEDFCKFTEMSPEEFYCALEKLYNKEIFEKNRFGQWRLKPEIIEKRRNP